MQELAAAALSSLSDYERQVILALGSTVYGGLPALPITLPDSARPYT